ncbi:HET-domain-containing protein [Hypoxylon sp. NC0597]|nr:HET-domain-containing protein [Hypoxylon sp. NC0597]
MQDNSFIYSPLGQDEFRLLRLRWVQGDDDYNHEDTRVLVECELTHHSLDSSPHYTALSYTWGTDLPSRRTKINGKSILIRENLYSFFNQLLSQEHRNETARTGDRSIPPSNRGLEGKQEQGSNPGEPKPSTESYWWIDALCINQSDLPERSAQVTQMRRIYSQAQRIAIWLGPAADESDLAMEAYRSYPRAAGSRTPKEGIEEWFKSLPHDALGKLAQRSWWQRVWVWQEATTPRVPIEFWCGTSRVSFDDMYAANEAIGKRKNYPYDGVFPYNNNLYAMRQLGASRAGRSATIYISPLWLLDEGTRLAATDPRDRVYALLPIWDELQRENMPQEKKKSVPIDYQLDAEEVFRLATVYTLKHLPRRLEILKKCICNRDGTFRRYSWVPDMSDERISKPWSLFVDFFARQKAPEPDFDPELKFSKDMTAISIRAYLISFIKYEYSPIGRNEDVIALDPDLWEARYRTWIRKLGERAFPNFEDRPYAGGGLVSAAVDKLLTFNRMVAGVPVKHWPVLEVAKFNFSALPDPQTVLRSGPREFKFGMSCTSLIETRDGYLGAAMPGVRVGDALVGIPGISCPVALRSDRGIWRIVGCIYVVGLSDRKSWGPEIETTEFVIT